MISPGVATIEAAVVTESVLLARPSLTVVSGEPDFDLQQIAQIITGSVIVSGRAQLQELFDRLLAAVGRAAAVTPKTLDLIGHTRSSSSLLTLGDWVIDASNPTTARWFRELADRAVLPRLGIHALRLLGCSSAGTAPGRDTVGLLADLLGVEVYGSRQLLNPAHYDPGGFRDCWSFLLVTARELRRDATEPAVTPANAADPRVLDLDALPAVALGTHGSPCPRRIATTHAARQILQLVRRHEGAAMPGLSPTPMYELALPAATPGTYHVAHVLFDGEFLRFYPGGVAATAVVFPVDDARALRRVLAALEPDPELSR